ncbi:hypothetical protein PILCRDRAFT_810007, partial [Piloderma croceum F 1598]
MILKTDVRGFVLVGSYIRYLYLSPSSEKEICGLQKDDKVVLKCPRDLTFTSEL